MFLHWVLPFRRWQIIRIEPYFNNKMLISVKPHFEGQIFISKEKVSMLKIWLNF